MPIIKELKIKDTPSTDDEYTLYANKGLNYLFNVVNDMIVVDLYLPMFLYNQIDFVGSLSFFYEEGDYPMIDLAFISEKHRRKGYMYDLYEFLIEKYGAVISDTQISQSAFQMWTKLAKTYTVEEIAIANDGQDSPTRFIVRK